MEVAMEEKCIRTGFIFAAEKGNIRKVKFLYKTVANLASKDEKFYCALYLAALNGHEKVVKFLLEQKVNQNLVIKNFLTPLHAAAFGNNKKIVDMLLNHGADVNPKIKVTSGEGTLELDYFCSPLLIAAWKGNEDLVTKFLQNGAEVNVKLKANADVIKKLRHESEQDKFENCLNYGKFAWYALQIRAEYSILHFAVDSENEKISKILIKFGADLNARCSKDLTPLCVACERKNVSLVNCLLQAGSDLNLEVNNGKHLLRYILKLNHSNSFDEFYDDHEKNWLQLNPVFCHLLKIGADPNAWSSKKTENLLHYAAKNGMVHAVHLLLKYGASSNAVDGEAKTPLEYSVEQLQKILKNIQENYSQAPDSSSDEDSESSYFSDSSEQELYERVKNSFKTRHRNDGGQKSEKKIYNLAHNRYVYNVRDYKHPYLMSGQFSVFKDPDPFRLISQLLTRDLVRLEALGTRIVQQNVKLFASTFVKPYYNRCCSELKKMKKHSIASGVSYYDLLLADDSKLVEYMKHKFAIDKETYRKLFPNYCRFLELNIERGLESKSSSIDEETNKWTETEKLGKGSVQMKKR